MKTDSNKNTVVFFDFDNTITTRDAFDDMLLRFAEDDSWRSLEERWKNKEIGSRQCLGCREELEPHRQGACCSGRCRASLSRRRLEEAQLRRDEEVRAGLEVVRAVVDDVLVLRAVVDDLMARLEGRNGKGRRA